MLERNKEFRKSSLDQRIEQMIAAHCAEFSIDPLVAIKLFPVLARRQWLKRFLAHSDLFRLTLEVPGDIAEFGVFRGASLFTWANLLETYCIGDRTKTVFGFDDFAGVDGDFIADEKELENAIAIFDFDRFIPSKPRIRLIKGKIERTAIEFLDLNPGLRFSLVHFDCDSYDPTVIALDAIWNRISRGGVVIFDEYAIPHWQGETAAVDDFIQDKPELRLRTLPGTNTPGAYLIKPSLYGKSRWELREWLTA